MSKPQKPAPAPLLPVTFNVIAAVRDWRIQPVLDQLKKMEVRIMSALDDLATNIQTAVDENTKITTQGIADAQKSFADLIALGKSGADTSAAEKSLGDSLAKLAAANKAMQDFDAAAIAADPTTPPPVPPTPAP